MKRLQKILPNLYGGRVSFEAEHSFHPAKFSRHSHSYIMQVDFIYDGKIKI